MSSDGLGGTVQGRQQGKLVFANPLLKIPNHVHLTALYTDVFFFYQNGSK